MSQQRNIWMQMRVSASEKQQILDKIAAEFGEKTSFSNAARTMWGLEQLDRAESMKGNKNKLGKKGANAKTKNDY